MLRSKSLKVAGLLLIAVFLLVSLSAPVMARGSSKNGQPIVQQNSRSSHGDGTVYIAAGGAILAIFVIGSTVFGRRSDGTVTPIGRTDNGSTRSDISRNSGR